MDNEKDKHSNIEMNSVPEDVKTVVTDYLEQALWWGGNMMTTLLKRHSLSDNEVDRRFAKGIRAVAEAIAEDMEYAYPGLRNLWPIPIEKAEYDPRLELPDGVLERPPIHKAQDEANAGEKEESTDATDHRQGSV